MYRERVLGLGDDADRREVVDRVVWNFESAHGKNRVRSDIAEKQRVAIGRRLRREIGTDLSARAGAVVDDELLFERLRKRLRNDPGRRVCAPARWIGSDYPHGPCGVALG